MNTVGGFYHKMQTLQQTKIEGEKCICLGKNSLQQYLLNMPANRLKAIKTYIIC